MHSGAYNAILRLKDGKWAVEDVAALDKTLHPQISPEELMECEMIVRKDARIQQLAKEVGQEWNTIPREAHNSLSIMLH